MPSQAPDHHSTTLAPMPEPIVGIDLGTTNSLVAVAGWPAGHADAAAPRIIPDSLGRNLLPSVVRFGPSPAHDNLRPVAMGYEAKDRAVEFPLTTIASVKRLMGRSLADANADIPYLSFRVVEGPQQTARVAIPFADSNTWVFQTVSPQEVSAIILQQLREQASASLGTPVRKAVITVPAYFDDAQRQATRDAARLAGLEVVRIVNEPTAAALAYGIGLRAAADSRHAKPQVIAVYDLGGGTFDVSILRLTPATTHEKPTTVPLTLAPQGQCGSSGSSTVNPAPPAAADSFQVLATAGDTHLGGDDFDHALVKLFTDEIRSQLHGASSSRGPVAHEQTSPERERAGMNDSASSPAHLRSGLVDLAAASIEFPPGTRRALLQFAERTKIRLSDHEEAHIKIDLDPGMPPYTRTLTRGEFESLVAPLVERTITACKRAMRDARRTMDDAGESVDVVVLVGGQTRMPLVRRRVAEHFGVQPYTALDPDLVVALGAAVQGAVISGATTNTLLLDVVPLSLGVETIGGAVAKLVMRNSTVPTQADELFSTSIDGQTSIKLHVVQGEREMAADCRSLGTFHLAGIPPMPAGIPKLRVRFIVDVNGILGVSAVEERSGKAASIQVVPNHGLTRQEVQRMEAESFAHAKDDMERHRVVDLVANSKLDLHWIRHSLARVRALLDPAYVAELEAHIDTLADLVAKAQHDWKTVNPGKFHEAKESLDRVSIRLHEVAIAESLKGVGS